MIKKFNKPNQKVLEKLLNPQKPKETNDPWFLDWDFELNGKPQQIFKAGEEYCHSIGGKDNFTNDAWFFDLEKKNPKPEDCHPFSDKDLAPRWRIDVSYPELNLQGFLLRWI